MFLLSNYYNKTLLCAEQNLISVPNILKNRNFEFESLRIQKI